MNIKKYILGAGFASLILMGAVSLALANDNNGNKPESTNHPQPMIVQIGSSGNALLRGNIKSLGTNSFVLTSWGGDWMINFTSSTNLTPWGDYSQFKVGDFVGVNGKINTNSSFTVDAKIVRDWEIRKVEQNAMKSIKELMKSLLPRNWQGTASNISSNSFTLTIEGTAYTVNVAATAKIVNNHYGTISLSDIQNGDTVRIYGVFSGNVATAYVVRDTSR